MWSWKFKSVVTFLTLTCFLFLRSPCVPRSVYALYKFHEQCNKYFNVASSDERLHMKFWIARRVSFPKKAQVGCGQALSKHIVLLEEFLKIDPAITGTRDTGTARGPTGSLGTTISKECELKN